MLLKILALALVLTLASPAWPPPRVRAPGRGRPPATPPPSLAARRVDRPAAEPSEAPEARAVASPSRRGRREPDATRTTARPCRRSRSDESAVATKTLAERQGDHQPRPGRVGDGQVGRRQAREGGEERPRAARSKDRVATTSDGPGGRGPCRPARPARRSRHRRLRVSPPARPGPRASRASTVAPHLANSAKNALARHDLLGHEHARPADLALRPSCAPRSPAGCPCRCRRRRRRTPCAPAPAARTRHSSRRPSLMPRTTPSR